MAFVNAAHVFGKDKKLRRQYTIQKSISQDDEVVEQEAKDLGEDVSEERT